MQNIFNKFEQVSSSDEFSLASSFSYQVNNAAINSINESILKCLFVYSVEHGLEYRPSISWLDEGWEIFKLGEAFFKLAQYIDSESAYLNVVIVDYPETGNSKSYKKSSRLTNYGKIKGLRLKISQKIKLDPAVLLETLSKTAEVAYQHANVDYQAALRDFCLATLGDILYDVLRKSAINKIIQKEISLYCVYSAMGRHIPSIERVSTIVSTISSGIPSKDLDPIRLAMDFFLTPLDGRKFELYTQKAFRENKSLIAKGTNYTGVSYVRVATEAFFKNSDVTVQPITKINDEEWLLSAIYPSRFQELIHPEIEKCKEEFANVAIRIQEQSRDTLGKLEKMSLKRSNQIPNTTMFGEFVGGVIKAFMQSA